MSGKLPTNVSLHYVEVSVIKDQETPILDTSGQKFSWVCFTFLEVVLQLGFCKGPVGMFGHCQNIPGMPGMPGN